MKYSPKKTSYDTTPDGKSISKPVERFEKRRSSVLGHKPVSTYNVQNPVAFAGALGRTRHNRTRAKVTTLSKKAYIEGFNSVWNLLGLPAQLLKQAGMPSFDAPYIPGYDKSVSGPLALAVGIGAPMAMQNISQLMSTGERLLQQEAQQKARQRQLLAMQAGAYGSGY